MLCDPDNLHPRLSTTGSSQLRFCDMGHILSPLFHLQCCKSIVLLLSICVHNYAKHYKAVHVQDGECGAGPRKPDFPSKLRCLFEQQALYNLCRSHKYLSVSPGGVCFINSGSTTYRWRFKFYLTCCVLVSPRTNVDYFI